MNSELADVTQDEKHVLLTCPKSNVLGQSMNFNNCTNITELFKQDNVAEYCRLILHLYQIYNIYKCISISHPYYIFMYVTKYLSIAGYLIVYCAARISYGVGLISYLRSLVIYT